MSRSRKNILIKAKLVQDLVAEHYEPGRHDKCKRWVFLHVVSKVYPMTERTFFRYLSIDVNDVNNDKKEEDKRQLKLF